jgi:HD-GYP domain-containing protein (c-di-GMP phosphodiesterase class II)
MLEDRPYRPALTLEAALAEVARFAPEAIVKAVGEAVGKIPGLMAGPIEHAQPAG